jgi:AraC family transcriptional regulator
LVVGGIGPAPLLRRAGDTHAGERCNDGAARIILPVQERHFHETRAFLSQTDQADSVKPWIFVRHKLGVAPVVAGAMPGPWSVYAERYFLRRVDIYGPPMDCIMLYCQFGGARIREGIGSSTRAETGLNNGVLVPAGVETYWQYSGSVDYAVFYLPPTGGTGLDRVQEIARLSADPLAFSDALVNGCARQIVDEIDRGRRADPAYLERLGGVMFERLARVLAAEPDSGASAPQLQLLRLQSVIAHVRRQLTSDLSVERLAAIASVSVPHFRRVFRDAMGVPPHRYVLNERLKRARELLVQGDWPMSKIADECGFASQSHLSRCWAKEFGIAPTEYRARERHGGSRFVSARASRKRKRVS